MTFVLKELSELRKEFNDTVDIILKRNQKGKIEDLSNPRKYELQFLSSILVQLEEQKLRQNTQRHYSQHNQSTNTSQATIFYGAMLTIMKDIDNNRGLLDSPGLLSDRLADSMGMSENAKKENKPDLYQTSKFYTALNQFLNNIFIGNDSRNGFAKDHILHEVPTDNLNQLIKTAYKLEKNAQKEITDALLVDGKSTVKGSHFRNHKSLKLSPASATSQFEGWTNLNKALDNLIKDELADKNVSNIDKLSQHRAAQLHYLNAIRESLKTTGVDESEKVAILAGSMHIVRQQINKEYVISKVDTVIYNGLTKLLDCDETSPQDKEALINSATQFTRFMTIEPKTNGKKAIRTSNIFSAIPGFDLKTVLNLSIDMIHTCRTEALQEAVEEFKKLNKPSEKASTGYLGATLNVLSSFSLFGGKKIDISEEEDDDDELEHKKEVSHHKY